MSKQIPWDQYRRWDRVELWALVGLALLFSAGFAAYGSLGLLLVMIAAAIAERRVPWDSSPLDWPLWVLAGAVGLSAALSAFRPLALGSFGLLLLVFILGYGVTYRVLSRHPTTLAPVAVAWMIGAVAAAVMAIHAYLTTPLAILGPGTRTYHLGHTALGTTMAVASLISLGQVMARRSLPTTLLALLTAVLSTAGLVLTASRGAWLGWGVGVTALALVAVRRKVSGRALAATLGVVVLAGALLYVTKPTRLLQARGPSGPTRIYLWGLTASMISDHLWWGTGLGTFRLVYHQYLPNPAAYREDPPSAHNIYLNMFVEGGVIAGGAFVFLLLAAARIGWLHVARHHDPEAAGFFAAYLAVLARESVDGTILSYHLGLGFLMLLAIIAVLPVRARLSSFGGTGTI